MTINHDVMAALRRLDVENGVVSTVKGEEVLMRFSNDRMTVADVLNTTMVTVFVRENGRRGGVTLGETDSSKIVAAVEEMVVGLRRHGGGEDVPFPKGPFRYRSGSAPTAIDEERMAIAVEDAIRSARAAGAERSAGSLLASSSSLKVQTTAGADASEDLGAFELSLRSFCGQGSGHSLSIGRSMDELQPTIVGEEAGRAACLSRDPIDVSGGQRDAVLSPMVFADLVSQVGDMSSAFYVDMGMSFLSGRIGQKVASPNLDIIDDPVDGSVGTRAFDDEGHPTRSKPILKAGVLEGYLHNSQTAASHGTMTTGNAGLVSPHPFSLRTSVGRGTIEELAAKVDDGILVTNCWYLRYQNHSTGDFSVIPRDAMFVIEGGEVAGAVKGLRISDNLPRMLGAIESLGGDTRWTRWWEVDVPTYCPSALVNGVGFTRSTM